jgi:hypothetical protein
MPRRESPYSGCGRAAGKDRQFFTTKGNEIMQDKQVDIEEMEGKTIAKVFTDYCDELLIVFTDNNFALVYGYSVHDETTIENGDFRLSNWAKHADELLALGIVNQSQYDKHKADTEHYSRQAVAARRAEYERLKAEFENGPT